MKRLIVVRHAKSDWDDPDLSDFDRPLNERGKRDTPKMADRLKKRQVQPQQMISSPAIRAITTCNEFARILGFPLGQIQTIKALYHAGSGTLLSILQLVLEMEGTGSVILFGHNPGLTDFVNDLLDVEIDNIPTTGIIACKLNIKTWAEAKAGCGVLEYFDYPKLK